MALFGAHWIGVFDPIALLYRSTVITVLPAVGYVVEEGAASVYRHGPHIGPLELTDLTEPVYRFFRDRVFAAQRQTFAGSSLVLLALGSYGLWRARGITGHRDARPTGRHGYGPLRTYARFLGLTLLNPLTVAYFAALMLANG